jgi:hypothetical protein
LHVDTVLLRRLYVLIFHRAWHPPDAPRRRHFPSHRGVDRAAVPQPGPHPR